MNTFITGIFEGHGKNLSLEEKKSIYVLKIKTTPNLDKNLIYGEASIVSLGGNYLTRVLLSCNSENMQVRGKLEETIKDLSNLGFKSNGIETDDKLLKTNFRPYPINSVKLVELIKYLNEINKNKK